MNVSENKFFRVALTGSVQKDELAEEVLFLVEYDEKRKGVANINCYSKESFVKAGKESKWRDFVNHVFQKWIEESDDLSLFEISPDNIVEWDYLNFPAFPFDAVIPKFNIILKMNEKMVLKIKSSEITALLLKEIDAFETLSNETVEYQNELFEKEKELKNKLKDLTKEGVLDRKDIEKIKSRINEISEKNSLKRVSKLQDNETTISKMIDDAVETVKNNSKFKESWDMLKNLQEILKHAVLERETLEAFRMVVQDLFKELKNKQEKYFATLETSKKENYEKMVPLIEKCRETAKNSDSFKEAWAFLTKVQSEFKGLQLEKLEQEELWRKLSEAFIVLQEREKIYYKEKESLWIQNYENIKENVRETISAASEMELKKAWEFCKKVQSDFMGVKLKKEHHDELWTIIQKAFEKLKERQEQFKLDFDKIANTNFSRLDKLADITIREAQMNKNLTKVSEIIKGRREEIKGIEILGKEQRKSLYDKLSEAYEIIREKQDKVFGEKHKEWRKKQEEFLEKMEQKRERLKEISQKIEGNLVAAEQFIAELKVQIEEIEATPENKSKIDSLNQKIDEAASLITEKERSIKELAEKIVSVDEVIKDVSDKLAAPKR